MAMQMHQGFQQMDVPRDLSAAGVGAGTALLGGVVPVLGVITAVVLQLLESSHPQIKRYEYHTEGVMDGSVALIARALFRPVGVRPQACPSCKAKAAPCTGGCSHT